MFPRMQRESMVFMFCTRQWLAKSAMGKEGAAFSCGFDSC
ncbi:hypothetical protein PDR5_33780 [Pseudomonas sp. DR 5-09]|nr:hypothetical protein PDR5_33780 [Pseudomonas sp. DR 5-09]